MVFSLVLLVWLVVVLLGGHEDLRANSKELICIFLLGLYLLLDDLPFLVFKISKYT